MAEDKVKELSEKLMEGVQQTFLSDNFKKYLRFVSSFHNYSLRNTILIMLQHEKATQVAGFEAWKKHGRYVKRGEKGIAIFAPQKYKVKKEVVVLDELGNEKLNPDGTPMTESSDETRIKFAVTYVYDVSQTDGKPLPKICNELQGSVDQYEKIFNAIKKISPYKIVFEEIADGSKGYCNYSESKIAIKHGMSEEQIIKTLIHEFTHATLHEESDKCRERREIEAESVAFIVSDYLGIDTSSYSFGYVAVWSQGMELAELQSVLESIQQTASQIINSLHEELQLLEKSEIEPEGKIQNLSDRLNRAAEKSSELASDKEITNYEKKIS